MRMPESLVSHYLEWSYLPTNVQGLNKSVEIRTSKWDELLEMCTLAYASVVPIQEKWCVVHNVPVVNGG